MTDKHSEGRMFWSVSITCLTITMLVGLCAAVLIPERGFAEAVLVFSALLVGLILGCMAGVVIAPRRVQQDSDEPFTVTAYPLYHPNCRCALIEAPQEREVQR